MIESVDKARLCAKASDDKKAEDIIILDVSKLTSFTDYFVVCEAESQRQVRSIVKNVEEELKKQGSIPLGIEGLEESAWVLIDFGDVIFHCFSKSARSYYNLEEFWQKAPRISYP